MSSFIIPIAMVIAAGALFMGYIAPAYDGIKITRADVTQYDEALARFEELKQVRDRLKADYLAFSQDDVDKLLTILPDNLDNIRFALDLDAIADKNNVQLSELEIATDGEAAPALAPDGTPIDETLTLGSSMIKFSVEGTYSNMVAFLTDLEANLRIVDVTEFAFTEGEDGSTNYTVTVRMYWLK